VLFDHWGVVMGGGLNHLVGGIAGVVGYWGILLVVCDCDDGCF